MSDDTPLTDLSARLRSFMVLFQPCLESSEEEMRAMAVDDLDRAWKLLFADIKDDTANFLKIRTFVAAVALVHDPKRENVMGLVTRFVVCKRQGKWDEDLQMLLDAFNESCQPFVLDYALTTAPEPEE